jgi:hypothetical protein
MVKQLYWLIFDYEKFWFWRHAQCIKDDKVTGGLFTTGYFQCRRHNSFLAA